MELWQWNLPLQVMYANKNKDKHKKHSFSLPKWRENNH
jgi:hypothetical protein